MAKPKPTHVIRHEIILGKVEREMAEALALSKTASNLVIPIAVTVGTVGVGLGGYAAYQWVKDNVDAFEDLLKRGALAVAVGPGATSARTAPVTWSILKGFFFPPKDEETEPEDV